MRAFSENSGEGVRPVSHTRPSTSPQTSFRERCATWKSAEKRYQHAARPRGRVMASMISGKTLQFSRICANCVNILRNEFGDDFLAVFRASIGITVFLSHS
jgi:hypothetical protein